MKSPDLAILRFIFAALALWLLFVAWAQNDLSSSAMPPRSAERPILILHGPGQAAEARLVAQLAGRFGRPELRPLAAYETGLFDRSTATIILPAPGMPDSVFDDVPNARRPVVWFAQGDDVHFAQIAHRGQIFPGSGAAAPRLDIAPGETAEVLATGRTADGAQLPWALRSGNVTYVAELPWHAGEASDRHLIFADLLFDIVAPGAPQRRRALIRIAELGPETNARRLRSLVDLLSAGRVPFEMSVRGGSRSLDAMRRDAALASALRHGAARGGVLALRDPPAPRPDAMPPAPFETVDGDGALVIPDNLTDADQAVRHLAVRDSMISYSHRWDSPPEALQRVVAELGRLGYRFVHPRDAVRTAPAHAEVPLRRASPLSLAAAGWLAALPWIDLPLLVSLLALVTAMWLGGEMLLALLDGRPRRHGSRKLKPGLRNPRVAKLLLPPPPKPASI